MIQNIRTNSLYDDEPLKKNNKINIDTENVDDIFIELDYGISIKDSIIYFHNDIVIGNLFDFIAKVRTITNNRDESSKDSPINVLINSDGGDMYETLGIIDYMKSCSVPINVIARGRAFSAAALLVCNATGLRCASKNTTLMVHEVSTEIFGPMSHVKLSTDHINIINETMYSLLESRTKKDKEFWKQNCLKDFYMTAEQALELGLIDKIV